MSEFGTNHQLVFHGAGYDAFMPGGTPVPGSVMMTRQADVRRDPAEAGKAVVIPRPHASLPEVGLYAATAAVLCDRPVLVSSDVGMFSVDPCEQAPNPDVSEQFLVVRRFSRIATGMLEQHVRYGDRPLDYFRIGGLAMQFLRRYRNAQAWRAKRFREASRSGEQFPD